MTPAFSSVGSASPLGTANTTSTSPFAMPMSAATMSPDDMLRVYATTHVDPCTIADALGCGFQSLSHGNGEISCTFSFTPSPKPGVQV
ncbi:hypothetical protein B0H10DRAFT_2206448 [Mycena sp. CBHHK59/15]|nr:hypothetical protein B0H10DRAFT_2206448 [Mycena sp. CBHHK59/15]